MKNDFYAEYPAAGALEFANLRKNPPAGDARTLVALLAQTASLEETKLSGQEAYQEAMRHPSYERAMKDGKTLLEELGLGPPETPLWNSLPEYSFFIRADFRLGTPYLGRDDRAFSVTDNPVRKERVFGVPFISSTSWKGALRNACAMTKGDAATRTDWVRLLDRVFGPKHEGDEEFEGFRGRVRTYPSFFARIEFEMINPHSRATRTGRNPIRMESVPAGAESRLALLYAPLSDCQGEQEKPDRPDRVRREAVQDLIALAEGCRAMLLDLGFSAKRSSGYGAAQAALVNKLGMVTVKTENGVVERPFATLDELPGRANVLAAEMSV